MVVVCDFICAGSLCRHRCFHSGVVEETGINSLFAEAGMDGPDAEVPYDPCSSTSPWLCLEYHKQWSYIALRSSIAVYALAISLRPQTASSVQHVLSAQSSFDPPSEACFEGARRLSIVAKISKFHSQNQCEAFHVACRRELPSRLSANLEPCRCPASWRFDLDVG